MLRSILMVTILLANVGFSQDRASDHSKTSDRVLKDKLQKSQSDTEGRIYEVLADFKVSFDDYRSRPHAFLATGVRRDLRESTGFVESRVLWTAARMDEQAYDANAFFQPGGIVPKWYQRISIHGKKLYRTTSPTAAPLDPSGDAEFDETEFLRRQQLIVVQPFSATISPATVFRNSQRFGEDHWHRFFLKAEFVKGDYDDDGNLVGHWRNTEGTKSGNRTYATLIFSKEQNWLP
ncbi:hypothetical protein, partial [Stieleria mannarensis]|uniref:hypothetical protein n=1 Tax=Stieleria mannarensis TaxID=2755585 RepID=UPI0016015FA5